MRTRTLLIFRAGYNTIMESTGCVTHFNSGIVWLMYLQPVCSMAQVFSILKSVGPRTVIGNMSLEGFQTFTMTIDKFLQHQLLFSNLIETPLFRKAAPGPLYLRVFMYLSSAKNRSLDLAALGR